MGEIRSHDIEYREGDDVFEGFVAWEEDRASRGPLPGVLILHDWSGLHEASRQRAARLAGMGYVGFAVDAYGRGRRGVVGGVNSHLMDPLMGDRALLGRRLLAAVETCASLVQVDASRLAAIGYCFGGLCALDLARANAPGLRGAVSFHGIYAPPGLGPQAPIQAKVLVCHGWEDPFTPPDATLGLAKELTEAGADWQLHAYGHTLHAFASEGANAPDMGAKYDATADRRSFAAMSYFLEEVLA